ncbi:putative RNA-directed DNA polymerase [Helianthus annuus]|nr:putative RNA-directed DNA polymerase [Helianthus annuus]
MVFTHGISFLSLQESKCSSLSRSELALMWGKKDFGLDFVDSVGLSGGLICIWDDKLFRQTGGSKDRHFLHVRGTLVGCGDVVNVLIVYAPQGASAKQALWGVLKNIIDLNDGLWVVAGDFNAVRFREERRNCAFKQTCANHFNEFIFDTGLIEYSMSGRKFTFFSDNGNKCSKLDRFLVNSEFFNSWPAASCRVLSRLWSDHNPIILVCRASNFGPRPFRFFNSWIEKTGFEDVVINAISEFDRGDVNPDVTLIRKLCFIRDRLRTWKEDLVRREGEELEGAVNELESLEELLDHRDLSEEEEWMYYENKKIICEAERSKVLDLKQKSRIRWAKDGDENSKFFHAMINNRKATNTIHGLEVNGVWISKPSLVKKEVFRFFRDKFVEEAVSRPPFVCSLFKKISSSSAASLEVRFSMEEIKAAVFGCGKDRAPGPDGFNFRFFTHFWDLFASDFYSILDSFFMSGKLSTGCGSAFIALIPKLRDPLGLNDYRPISLVGVVNKVVSKVMANRLKPVLNEVVSNSQSAFLGGRFILDGPMIINEIFAWAKNKKKQVFFLKVDFEKAYDNVNWGFLINTLHQMGFGKKWCSWVSGILSSARASVLVNGSPTFEFGCSKGMRQGDPISPFLFVVAMEALSCLFNRACEENVFKGITLPDNNTNVSHLLFADDAMIMGIWDRENISNVIRILRCFHVCSGLKINLNKSSIFGIGVSTEDIIETASWIGCRVDSIPFKYLGLTVGANMNRINNWRPVYDIFEKRLSLWKAALLSIGGRVTLIRSVLESLPTYFMSLYKAPKKVIKDLESIIKKFLWGGSSNVRKTHWVAWDRVTLPRKAGGLGLSKLADINAALLCKWVWRFKNEPDSLWVSVINAIHSGRSEWVLLPFNKAIRGTWSNICNIINKVFIDNKPLRRFFKGEVGSGVDIYFWLDPWIAEEPLKDLFPLLFRLETVKNCSVSDRLAGGICWLWSSDPEGVEEIQELASLSGLISSVVLRSSRDKWRWSGDASGLFTVKSVKHLLVRGRCDPEFFVLDWSNWIPIKHNILAWRIVLNRIPTYDALLARSIVSQPGTCPLCGDEDESVSHLFISCRIADLVWHKVSRWCRIPTIYAFSTKDLFEVHKFSHMSRTDSKVLQGIIIIACWCIWLARNKAVFEGYQAKAEEIFGNVRSMGFFLFKHRSLFQSISWSDWCKFVIM